MSAHVHALHYKAEMPKSKWGIQNDLFVHFLTI